MEATSRPRRDRCPSWVKRWREISASSSTESRRLSAGVDAGRTGVDHLRKGASAAVGIDGLPVAMLNATAIRL